MKKESKYMSIKVKVIFVALAVIVLLTAVLTLVFAGSNTKAAVESAPVSKAACSYGNNFSSSCQHKIKMMSNAIANTFPVTTVPGEQLISLQEVTKAFGTNMPKGGIFHSLLTTFSVSGPHFGDTTRPGLPSNLPVWVIYITGITIQSSFGGPENVPIFHSMGYEIDAINGSTISMCEGCGTIGLSSNSQIVFN